jgi:hypothetical protein
LNAASGRGGGLFLATPGPSSPGFETGFHGSFLPLAYNGASSGGSGANIYIDAAPGARRWAMRYSLITKGSHGGNCGGQPVASLGFNLEDQNVCSFNTAGDMILTNPLVGALTFDNSKTKVHPLPRNSPAVDAIPDCGRLWKDQRGVTRPKDGNGDSISRCDIGAYELDNR